MNQLHNFILQRKQLKELILSLLTDDKKLEFLEWYDTKMKRKYGGNWNTDFTLLLKIIDWENMIDSDIYFWNGWMVVNDSTPYIPLLLWVHEHDGVVFLY